MGSAFTMRIAELHVVRLSWRSDLYPGAIVNDQGLENMPPPRWLGVWSLLALAVPIGYWGLLDWAPEPPIGTIEELDVPPFLPFTRHPLGGPSYFNL